MVSESKLNYLGYGGLVPVVHTASAVISTTQLLYSTPIVYCYIYSLHFTSIKFCQQNNWNRIQNIAQVLSKTLVSKHRYPFHNKALCVCLWARPSGRDTDTRDSFTTPPDLSANYSHVCQHAMWWTEPGECRDHYTPSGKTSGLDLWGLIISLKWKGREELIVAPSMFTT